MKKIMATVILALGASLFVQPLFAEEQQKNSVSLWDSLRQKIETLTPKKKLGSTSAVGGVRGALVESEDLYWKGKTEDMRIEGVELKDFDNALVLYESGNTEGARNAFGKFVKEYPESALLADAKKALELLQ